MKYERPSWLPEPADDALVDHDLMLRLFDVPAARTILAMDREIERLSEEGLETAAEIRYEVLKFAALWAREMLTHEDRSDH